MMMLCGALGVICWATSQTDAARALGVIMCAYVAVRINHAVFAGSDIALAVGALIWAIAATSVFRLGSTTASGIMVASALCYFWAKASSAAIEVGSAPFVASDVLMAVAMVWIGWHGIGVISSRALDLVGGGWRDSSAVDTAGDMLASEKDPP